MNSEHLPRLGCGLQKSIKKDVPFSVGHLCKSAYCSPN